MRQETSLLFEMKLTAGSAPALAIKDLRSAYLSRSRWVEDATWRKVASAVGGGRIGAKRGQRDRSAVEKLTGVIFDWGLAIAVNGEVDVGYNFSDRRAAADVESKGRSVGFSLDAGKTS
ncbi:hypothetical protein BHM03_00045464 [Ensete ventricosum]|nr:hypothetical protein BHM03_00045464 [Ensete ventricosum]